VLHSNHSLYFNCNTEQSYSSSKQSNFSGTPCTHSHWHKLQHS